MLSSITVLLIVCYRTSVTLHTTNHDKAIYAFIIIQLDIVDAVQSQWDNGPATCLLLSSWAWVQQIDGVTVDNNSLSRSLDWVKKVHVSLTVRHLGGVHVKKDYPAARRPTLANKLVFTLGLLFTMRPVPDIHTGKGQNCTKEILFCPWYH